MKRILASALAILVLSGCAGVKPSGEVTAGLPGVASGTLNIDRDASPAEVLAAIETAFQQCLDRQHQLTNGNPCLCLIGHPQHARIASMKGFTQCFPSNETPPVEPLSCPVAPDPPPCPTAAPCPEVELPVVVDGVMPEWCRANHDSPYCLEVAKRLVAEKGLKVYQDRMDTIKGCDKVEGKDGYHVSGKATYACDNPASATIEWERQKEGVIGDLLNESP